MQKLIDALEDADDEMFQEQKTVCKNNDFYATDNFYHSKYLEQYGVLMDLNQTISTPSGIRLAINPSTYITREYNPLALYSPREDRAVLQRIQSTLHKELSKLSKIKKLKKHLSLSRIDLTSDLYFDPEVDLTEIIRLFRKSHHPRYFREDYSSPKGQKIDKHHCYRIHSKHVSITVYDKTYDMARKGYIDMNYHQVLRIEVSLDHEGYNRKLGSDRIITLTHDEILYQIYQQLPNIMNSYLKRLFPCSGKHLPYEKAKAIIEREITNNTKREQMLYCLKKASSDACLNVAAEECINRFGITKKVIKRLYKDFDKLDVNVLTFKKDSKIKTLPSLRFLLI